MLLSSIEICLVMTLQPQPLMQLHEEENTKGKLVCSLLPQKGPYNLSMGKSLHRVAKSGHDLSIQISSL